MTLTPIFSFQTPSIHIMEDHGQNLVLDLTHTAGDPTHLFSVVHHIHYFTEQA